MNDIYIARREKKIKESADYIAERVELMKKQTSQGQICMHVFPYSKRLFEECGKFVQMSFKEYALEVSKALFTRHSIPSEVISDFNCSTIVISYVGTRH